MNKVKRAVIFGISGFSQIVDYYLTNDSEYEVVAITASDDQITQSRFCGYPVVGFDSLTENYSPEEHELFIAVGYTKMNATREKIFEQSKEKGYKLLSYVNSRATVWDQLEIGENVFILDENTIQPFVTIGDNNIFWSGNHIGHHTTIGRNNFFSSHVVVSGYCQIGDNSFFGVNSTVADSLKIGDRNLIGPGALIQKSTGDDEAYLASRTDKHKAKSSRFM